MFHYTVSVSGSVEEVAQKLEKSLQEHKFGVLWQLDIPAKLQEKGVMFDQPYRVLEVCNPHEAKKVLSKNLLVGYFLPCKVVVYDDHGTTKVGMPKPSFLISTVEDETLRETAEHVERELIAAIDALS